jgi:hypothetical protein
MKLATCLFSLAALASTTAQAVVAIPVHQFDVNYFGQNQAQLVAGSEDPEGFSLMVGDYFHWSIKADGNGEWRVEQAYPGGFFPLMAFATNESGRRTGDFTLKLLNNGAEVFNQSETGSQQAQVHVGTNAIVLASGLVFDQMVLDYQLTSAVTDDQDALPVDTTLRGLLPIFGAPEMNTYYPGIVYAPVPEPTVAWLMLAGLAGLGFAARRRSA